MGQSPSNPLCIFFFETRCIIISSHFPASFLTIYGCFPTIFGHFPAISRHLSGIFGNFHCISRSFPFVSGHFRSFSRHFRSFLDHFRSFPVFGLHLLFFVWIHCSISVLSTHLICCIFFLALIIIFEERVVLSEWYADDITVFRHGQKLGWLSNIYILKRKMNFFYDLFVNIRFDFSFYRNWADQKNTHLKIWARSDKK